MVKKIGFVTPWYGEKIPGGAEMATRNLAEQLVKRELDIEILTTCVKEFMADWNVNYHTPGVSIYNGITIRRFPVRKRDEEAFARVNEKLMRGMLISREEEQTFISEMINSPQLYQYIKEHKDEYDLFIYIPYMFGTTYYGIKECPEKAVMIPCFHDEAYLYMDIFRELFSQVAGMAFNAEPEYELAKKVYDLSGVVTTVPGLGMNTDIVGNASEFRKKYDIQDPYILYAGRKDKGKNIYKLLQYFAEYRKRRNTKLKLVLIGGGEVEIPKEIEKSIIDLGYVDAQDKYNACAAAELMCQPSKHESFSLVIMESWLCGRPVLVHEKCEVTRHFAETSNGGLWFRDYFDFEGCVDYILEHPDKASRMGQQGRKFVLNNFTWDEVIRKYMELFEQVIKPNKDTLACENEGNNL